MGEDRTFQKDYPEWKRRGQSVDAWEQQNLKGREEKEALVKDTGELPDK